MGAPRDWSGMKAMSERLLERQTGEGLKVWSARVRKQRIGTEGELREWLTAQGVTGYAQSLVVMERFGYPDYLTASADELIGNQFADRPQLRPIYDAVIAAALECGDVEVQARKTYVSLLTPKRTFARIQAATKNCLDVALRLAGRAGDRRLRPSRVHESMPWQLELGHVAEVDAGARKLLRCAFEENAH